MSKRTPFSKPPKTTYRSTKEFLIDDSYLRQTRSGGNNGSPFPKDDNYRSVSVVPPQPSFHAYVHGSFGNNKPATFPTTPHPSGIASKTTPSHGMFDGSASKHTLLRGTPRSTSLLFGTRGLRRGIPMAPAKPLLINQKTSFECLPNYSSKDIKNALLEAIRNEGVDIRQETECTITGEFYPNHNKCRFNVNLYRTTSTEQQYLVEFQKLSGCTGKFLELYNRILTNCGEFVPQSALPKDPCIRRRFVATAVSFNTVEGHPEASATPNNVENAHSKEGNMRNLKHLMGLLSNPYNDVKTMAAMELACATDSKSTADALVMSAVGNVDDIYSTREALRGDVTIQTFFDTLFQILRERTCEDVRRCLFAVLLNVVQSYTRQLKSASAEKSVALESMKPKLQDAKIVIERAARDSDELRVTRTYAQQIVSELDLILI